MDQSEFDSRVRAAKNGDKDAFCELYETVYRKMYRVAFYALRHRQDAEDAVSEAVCDAFRNMRSLRDESKFEAWIFSILSSKIKKTMSRYRRKTAELSEEIASEPAFDDTVLDIKKELNALADDERLIIVLSAVCGYQSSEIASVVGKPAGTVRSRLSRATAKLRKRLIAEKGETQ